MSGTSVSLLERLRERPDGEAWQRLVAIYTPLLKQWLGRYGLQASDVDDLTQEVLAVLVRELPRFQHNQRTGAFRRWLRGIAVNRLRELWRNRGDAAHGGGDSDMARRIDQLEDPHSQVSKLWDLEHDRHVMGRLLVLIEAEFPTTWWRAFRRHVREGAPAAEVAAELNVSVNVVLLAKSRILRRMRQEAQGLID
jgi:RNA polymerase sigma-70 factor (ECF subfamily)